MPRHDTDLVSLVPGLLFAAIGTAALVDRADLLVVDWTLVWPVVLIGLGLLLLVSRPRRSRGDAAAVPADAGSAADDGIDRHVLGGRPRPHLVADHRGGHP